MEYGFYLYGWILKKKLREIVDIGFINGRGTGDAVFILMKLREKCWSKGKNLFYCSIYIYIYIYIYTLYYIYTYYIMYIYYIYIYPKALKFYPDTLKYWVLFSRASLTS